MAKVELRIERSNGQITASIEGTSVDLHQPKNLASIVNRIQALLHEFQINSLYEEFIYAARLEKSIRHKATEIFKLNEGNYQSSGLSVEINGSSIEIQLNQQLVFRSNQSLVQHPDDLLLLENLERQLQSTITNLQQTIEAKLKLDEARLEAERLKAQKESPSTSTIENKPKERGYGTTL